MNRISIYGNRQQEGYLPLLSRFFVRLLERGFEVSMASGFAASLRDQSVALPAEILVAEELPDDAECVVSIGGDGTFLRAAQWVGKREVPILGINTGHLGFLASYSLDQMEELMDVVADNTATYERRMVLQVSCASMPEDFWPYALNEVSLLRGETASMVTVHAEVNGHFLADYMADGLVVATPTGSTAYNLSVGGPIMEPTLQCLVLSPIAPHSLTMRPLVIDGGSVVTLHADSRIDNSRVSLDGRYYNIPSDGSALEIRKADFEVVVMRRPNSQFARLLRNKLLWGQR
ncbi:MAG: NAD(+)/NADH kinase [Muribaculaceae bacterium]|nr:NAD(+)/NADH kinase [Muribaculaceae bacterium]